MCVHVYGTIYSISTVEGSEGSGMHGYLYQQQNFRFPRFVTITSFKESLFFFINYSRL